MNKFLVAAAVATLMPICGAAYANDDTGHYGSFTAGWSSPSQIDTVNIINPAADEEISFSSGFAVAAALGHRFESNFRTELEFAWRSYDAESIVDHTGAFGPFNLEGDARVISVGVNMFYDFDVNDVIMPYIGGGIGMDRFDVSVQRAGGGGLNHWEAEKGSPYYQGMLGVNFPLQDRAEIFVEYRYMSTYSMEAVSNFGAFTPDKNTEDFNNNTIGIGGRMRF